MVVIKLVVNEPSEKRNRRQLLPTPANVKEKKSDVIQTKPNKIRYIPNTNNNKEEKKRR